MKTNMKKIISIVAVIAVCLISKSYVDQNKKQLKKNFAYSETPYFIEDDIATILKAFPSACGAGAYTTGGRGGTIYHVTNLNDSGAGSFRAAMEATGARIIVFDVSGVITLTSILYLDASNSNLTIAGQTAPEGGITIAGNRVFFNSVDNVICRYIRFRGGKDASDSDGSDRDSFLADDDITNHIFDHCSFSFGTDEAGSWYDGGSGFVQENITIQSCLFAESKTGTIVGELTGGGNNSNTISVIRNMWYNISHRFPNASGDNSRIDVINNVSWTVSARLVRANGGGLQLNHRGNYYDYGTRGINDDRLHMYGYDGLAYPQIYTDGNKIVAGTVSSPLVSSVSEMNANNKLMWKQFYDGSNTPLGSRDRGDQLEDEYFTFTPYTQLGEPFTILTADNAFADVKANVGCNSRLNGDGTTNDNTDVLDADWLNQVSQGNYVTPLAESAYIVPAISSVSRAANYDTDNDGMPDVWEVNTFGNLTKDGTVDTDGDGYTDLEEFLNLVDGEVTPPIPPSNIEYPLTNSQKSSSAKIIMQKVI